MRNGKLSLHRLAFPKYEKLTLPGVPSVALAGIQPASVPIGTPGCVGTSTLPVAKVTFGRYFAAGAVVGAGVPLPVPWQHGVAIEPVEQQPQLV